MQENGFSGEVLHYTKYLDDLTIKSRQENDGPVVFESPQENKGVGNVLNDRVVNDRDILSEVEEKESSPKTCG